VGCFVVGDDYGRPTNLPWGIRFPEGIPPSTAGNLAGQFGIAIDNVSPSTVVAVHPTQLYEIALMLLAFMVLWRLRLKPAPLGSLFALYLMFAGIERFLIEFLRAKDDRFLGGFTIAQLTSGFVSIAGLFLWIAVRTAPDPAPGPYLARPPSSPAQASDK
jgi:phosphatidylglycerol:prolipoprotein diacylglycerol transferase